MHVVIELNQTYNLFILFLRDYLIHVNVYVDLDSIHTYMLKMLTLDTLMQVQCALHA